MKFLLGLALLMSAAAQSAPVANLVLACPDENAIGQAGLDSCRGYVYQVPTDERIVAHGARLQPTSGAEPAISAANRYRARLHDPR